MRRKTVHPNVSSMSADEYLAIIKGEKGNKFGAVTSTQDGFTFQSNLERKRYNELILMRTGGLIRDLVPHPRYKLYGRTGILIGTFVADFEYYDLEYERLVIEDVKGNATRSASYIKNVKLLWDQTGIMTTEVLGTDDGSWEIRPAVDLATVTFRKGSK